MAAHTLNDPSICQDATRTTLAALRDLQAAGVQGKPLFAVVSTTGITSGKRDVPLLFLPLYHWGLAAPHEDKRKMEGLLREAARDGADAPFDGFVSVRPSLLFRGATKGTEVLRVGWEVDEAGAMKGPGPAVGYTITRDDVGLWVFEELVRSKGGSAWKGRYGSLTR